MAPQRTSPVPVGNPSSARLKEVYRQVYICLDSLPKLSQWNTNPSLRGTVHCEKGKSQIAVCKLTLSAGDVKCDCEHMPTWVHMARMIDQVLASMWLRVGTVDLCVPSSCFLTLQMMWIQNSCKESLYFLSDQGENPYSRRAKWKLIEYPLPTQTGKPEQYPNLRKAHGPSFPSCSDMCIVHVVIRMSAYIRDL